jgi:hypothetical protein
VTPHRRLLLAALLLPTATTSLGVDGGAIFQIAATESLGLSPRAVGIGFGMGILSVPVQLWAARLPLWRARRNLRLYCSLVAAQCVVLALLLAFLDKGDRLAVLALGITVLAEINVSVLYATTWQPLLAATLTPEQRQGLQSRGSAASGLLKAASAFVFGAAGRWVRVAFYALAGGVAASLVLVLRGVPAPERPPPEVEVPKAPIPASLRPLYLAVGLVAAGGTWPLFIVFVDQVLWPTVNLGLVAAVQVSGGLLASALWRTTTGDVGGRARWASSTATAAVLVLAFIPGRVDSGVEEAAFFVAVAGAAAATTIVFLTIMELVHREIDARTSVRTMTVFDVVASTSMQAGLVLAGFLISAGSTPYRAYLVVMSVASLAVIMRLASSSGERPGPAPRPEALLDSDAASALAPEGEAPPGPRPWQEG